jgi:hypothetical protein
LERPGTPASDSLSFDIKSAPKIDTPIMPPHWRRNMPVEVATLIWRIGAL